MLKVISIFSVLVALSLRPSSIESKEISGAEIQDLATKWLTNQGVESNIKILPQIKYQACDNIIFSNISINFKLIKAQCEKPSNWSFIIRNKLVTKNTLKKKSTNRKNKINNIIVLKKSLKRGQIVTADNLDFIESSIRTTSGLITSKELIVGKALKRSIRASKPIYESSLEKVWLIEKDSKIMIENNLGPITIKVDGIALENADLNERIKVKNIASGQILLGFVENRKKVRIRAKQF